MNTPATPENPVKTDKTQPFAGGRGILGKKNLRKLLMAGIMGLVILEIVALSPASLEVGAPAAKLSEESLVGSEQDAEATLATGIPRSRIPEYSIENFNYTSTSGERKQWNLVANRAFLYNAEQVVHARVVTAYLHNPDGKITVVTGREAKYFMNGRDLEIFGDVVTRFPDGFETRSEYLRYRPGIGKVDIPQKYLVQGGGQEEKGQHMAFKSQGMEFQMDQKLVVLPQAVHVTMTRTQPTGSHPRGSQEKTSIESDYCVINRAKQTAEFSMFAHRKVESRFVKINQPSLYAQSRRAVLNYGDNAKILEYLSAREDVLIREKPSAQQPSSERYCTGGRADFDAHRNVIVLRDFPQVYQDNDTITGELILVHRDNDLVEVEHSNAYSSGQ